MDGNPIFNEKYFRETNFTKDFVEKCYNLFFDNLIIITDYMEHGFKSVNDFIISEHTSPSGKDYFIEDGLKSLASNISDRGMYWPFFCRRYEKLLEVTEGAHRASALKKYFINKKYLTIIVGDLKIAPRYFDIKILYPSKNINTLLRKHNNFISFDKLEKDLYVAKSNNLYFLYEYTISIGLHVSRMIYPYRNEILPSKIINDEKEFKIWKEGSHFD